MKNNTISIALDGPAGVGKSTIAKALALELGYSYVDTGAMYRAVTLFALENNIPIDADHQQTMLELAMRKEFRFIFSDGLFQVYFGDRDITDEIRSLEVTRNVSYVAALPAVRAGMCALQRNMAADANVVMEGRDIGTVVLPDATYKFFLTASVEIRARRRYLELSARGISVSFEDLCREIAARDNLDSSRSHAPLRKAPDAVEIDTTDMNIEEVVARILSYME
ncbi:MAG: (d)CMP kinase [Firmicutes bacterium]|nr:(d)CMP kinase [Bacillota bacterium]HOB34137.1 (d)CMP kinase [Bacillota bacterium]HPZ90635.1 (d)CMP kinase [Bacillota bacterium]HQE02253.1 (d)CMP kinase [Bacillota bacterium]